LEPIFSDVSLHYKMPLKDIISIGLKDISEQEPEVDNAKAKKTKNVKLEVTNKEYNKLIKAIEKFSIISSSPLFYKCVKKGTNEELSPSQIHNNIVEPILNIIYKEQKKKSERKHSTTSFFTKQLKSTDGCLTLYLQIQENDLSLKFDQESNTCISDITAMLYSYLRMNRLYDEEFYFFDEFLTNLTPNSLQDVLKNPKRTYRSLCIKMAKEIAEY